MLMTQGPRPTEGCIALRVRADFVVKSTSSSCHLQLASISSSLCFDGKKQVFEDQPNFHSRVTPGCSRRQPKLRPHIQSWQPSSLNSQNTASRSSQRITTNRFNRIRALCAYTTRFTTHASRLTPIHTSTHENPTVLPSRPREPHNTNVEHAI